MSLYDGINSDGGVIYAHIMDVKRLRPLTAEEEEKIWPLLDQASAKLRVTARKYGKDVDEMIAASENGDLGRAVRSVIVQAVCRALDSLDGASSAVSQGTESIGAYSTTMTYFNAGQSLYFLKNELKDLGILRQTYGAVNLY